MPTTCRHRLRQCLFLLPCAFLIGGGSAIAHPQDTRMFGGSCDSNLYRGFYCYEAIYDYPNMFGSSFVNVRSTGNGYVESFGACDNCVGKWIGPGNAILYDTSSFFGTQKWLCKGRNYTGQTYGHCHQVD